RDPEGALPGKGLHLHLPAEDGHYQGDGDVGVEVVPAALEALVGLQLDPQEEVAPGPATDPGVSLAGDAQARPVAHPRRDLDLDPLPRRLTPGVGQVDHELPRAAGVGLLEGDLDLLLQVLPGPRAGPPAGRPPGAPPEEGLEELPQIAGGRLEV